MPKAQRLTSNSPKEVQLVHIACRRHRPSSAAGWALAELLTVLVLTAFLSSVLLQTTVCFKRCLAHWESSARMRETLSAAIFQMARDFRMAGCRPKEGPVFEGVSIAEGAEDGADEVEVRMDRRGPPPGSPPDGDIEDPGEDVIYRWDGGHRVLRRNNQPMATDIVENPWGGPFFSLTKGASRGLLRLSVTTHTREGSLSLSSAVCVRNVL